jgi:L-2,4-diaminobutyric acid acetyltransferase
MCKTGQRKPVQRLQSRKPEKTVTFRKPVREDGAAIWELIRACKPLDENSMYANLLQADHFRDTCIVAEIDGDLVGWISAYLVPQEPDCLFVWQVAVSEKARGMGLGSRMLEALLLRTETADVDRMRTTITLDNEASWALFRKFAKGRDAELTHEPHFKRDTHFQGEHATEHMVTITWREALKSAA